MLHRHMLLEIAEILLCQGGVRHKNAEIAVWIRVKQRVEHNSQRFDIAGIEGYQYIHLHEKSLPYLF